MELDLIGRTLSHYRISAAIGAGGMGEVYRATDTKLDREVAIKVLPQSLAQDPNRLARFEREAKVLASLNHPNIAHIYGIEERALIMELVPGETIKGPLPLPVALDYARQIAEALEAAHDKGIVHRDLKPANVMITPTGLVKVLDFGLATVLEGSILSGGDPSNAPTLTMGSTQSGIIVGTAAYMSPEQAAGKPVDRRADIWSYGAVLWEMLTGEPLFRGETVSHTLADVLRAPIDFDRLPKDTPREVRDLVKRCLDRDVKRRLRDIGEARIAIENVGREPEAAATAAASTLPWRRLPWIVVGLMTAAAAVSLWAPWRASQPVDRPLVRLDVDLGPDVSLPPFNVTGSSVAISPDGTRLVYASGTPKKLFIRRLDEPKATELPGTDGAEGPFFSPDGQWLGFEADGKLKKISVEGGAPILLCDVINFVGASWGEDGSIVFSSAVNRGLLQISSGGGEPETIAPLGSGEAALARPQILPGDKAVLFTTSTRRSEDEDRFDIEVLTLADHHRKIVARGGSTARYLATSKGIGHLVYTNGAKLFAIPFDLDKLETRGTAIPVLDDVGYFALFGGGGLDFSRAGTMVYRRTTAGVPATMSTVHWVDSAGKGEPLRLKPGAYSEPSLSPDGKRVALLFADGGRPDIWVYDLQRDAMTRLTFSGEFNESPIWSPDSQYVVFASVGRGIFWTRSDGGGQPQALITRKNYLVPTSFTPDGKRLAYYEFEGNPQVWTVPLEEQGGQLNAGQPEQLLKTSFSDVTPVFSPDGRWLAYVSNESGKNEVYVRTFPPQSSGQGGKWQVSTGGGTMPRWSRSGHELFYQSGGQILAATYTVRNDIFVADNPRVWIAKLGGTAWDLAPDGKRLAVLTPVDSTEVPKPEHEVVFILNFFDELRRRAPAGK
jgi:serine/threonine protein kinase/Tol biopolymer transport system component